jgi:hypothetical protein
VCHPRSQGDVSRSRRCEICGRATARCSPDNGTLLFFYCVNTVSERHPLRVPGLLSSEEQMRCAVRHEAEEHTDSDRPCDVRKTPRYLCRSGWGLGYTVNFGTRTSRVHLGVVLAAVSGMVFLAPRSS